MFNMINISYVHSQSFSQGGSVHFSIGIKISFQFQPANFQIFKTETDFRNCLSCTRTKFAGQELFSVCWSGNVFPFKTDSFQTKSPSQYKQVKHCHHPSAFLSSHSMCMLQTCWCGSCGKFNNCGELNQSVVGNCS